MMRAVSKVVDMADPFGYSVGVRQLKGPTGPNRVERRQGRVDVRRMRVLTGVALAVSAFIAVGPLFAEDTGDAKAGKEKYLTLCASCHGTSGKGDGPAAAALNPKPRDHTNGKYMNTLTNEYLFNVIKKGGKAVGLSELMPPWGRALSDKDIQDLVVYVRTLAVPPYKPPRK